MLHRTQPVIARKAVSNFLSEPSKQRSFDAAMQHCRKERLDMASQLTSDFLLLQTKLVKYRIVRLAEEINYIRGKPFGCLPSGKALVAHAVGLPAVFSVGLYFGRGSMTPLEEVPQAE